MQRDGHFSKKQDNLRYVFIHKLPDTLCHAIFHETFEIGIYCMVEIDGNFMPNTLI